MRDSTTDDNNNKIFIYVQQGSTVLSLNIALAHNSSVAFLEEAGLVYGRFGLYIPSGFATDVASRTMIFIGQF